MIPDYCEALTGYRCWNVFPNGLMIGQAHAEPWPPFAPFVGRCGHSISPDHVVRGEWFPAPVMNCDCGVHALKESAAAEQRLIAEIEKSGSAFGFLTIFSDYVPPKGRVWGAVKLWGRIIEHEIGYRAEFAYPSALFCQDKELAGIVSALYGVPCEAKKLAIPAPKPDESDSGLTYWYTSQQFQPFTAPTYPPAWTVVSGYISPSPPPSVIQPATLAQVKALGSSRYQRKAAGIAAAQKEEVAAKKRDLIQRYLDKGAHKIHVEIEA